MNGLKKWMVVLMTGVTLMGNVIGMGTTVIASKNETQESLSGVDVYMPENGSLERVIRVYEDGSFVTEPINDIRTYATNTPCEHPARYLEARGKKTDFQTVGTAGICYKERLIISNKCKKCTDCTACLKKGTCDRFYCYNRYPAQITLDDGSRTTVSNANSRVESIERKKEVEAQIQTKTYIKKNGITIIEILKKIGDTKFEAGKIIKNTKDKDEYHYKYIEKWDDFKQPVQKVTYNQVQNFLNSIRHLSQGEIDKIIAKLKNGFMQCVKDKIISYPDNPMLRIYPPVSNQHKEPVQAFEVDEQQKLMDYLLHNSLIKSSKCNYNETTLRNLFLCALLSAARIRRIRSYKFQYRH